MVLTIEDEANSMGPVFTICGTLSSCGSLLVLLTGYLFPHMLRNRLYMKILTAIAACDAIASVSFAAGYVADPPSCAFQGGIEIFFFRASWFWTAAISYELYSLVCFNAVSMSFRKLNLIIWPLNIILELLPLFIPHGVNEMSANVQYGTDDERYGKIICSFRKADENGDAHVVNNVAIGVLFVPLCCTILVMCSCWFGTYYHYQTVKERLDTRESLGVGLRDRLLEAGCPDEAQDEDGKADELERLLERLRDMVWAMSLYPLCLFVTWVPLFVFFIVGSGFRSGDGAGPAPAGKTGELVAISFAALHGFLLSVVFITHSPEARRNWGRWLGRNNNM